MEKKVIGILIIFFSIFWITMYLGNKENIVSIEKNTTEERGRFYISETHYCKSGNYYIVSESNFYTKYDKDGVVLENGKFQDGKFLPEYKGKYLRMDMILAFVLILIAAFIIIWIYSSEFSPIQAIRDKYTHQKTIPYQELSLEKQKLIEDKNPCIQCKGNPQLNFQEEEYDKKWDISHIHFYCNQCNQTIKIRRK